MDKKERPTHGWDNENLDKHSGRITFILIIIFTILFLIVTVLENQGMLP